MRTHACVLIQCMCQCMCPHSMALLSLACVLIQCCLFIISCKYANARACGAHARVYTFVCVHECVHVHVVHTCVCV